MTASIINLTRGAPPVDVFPTEDLIRCSESALRQYGNVLLQYGNSPGFLPLREWFGQRHNVSAGQIFMGNSSLEIMDFLTHVAMKPGDRVFVEVPTYDRTITLLRRAGAKLVGIPMKNDGPDLNVFEDELKVGKPAFAYIIPDFQNPSGITASVNHRSQLANWAKQYDFLIVEDSPYRALRYMGSEIPTIYSFAPQHVLHMSSLSKQLAPGLRLGYLIGSEAMVTKLVNWAINTYIGPVTMTQGMTYEYCRQGLLDKNIQKLKTIYRPRLDTLISSLDQHLPQVCYAHPEGGYYLSFNLPMGNHMDDLLSKVSRVGLKLSDGRGFFVNPSEGERFLRIPFCSVTPEEIESAVPRLKSILS